MGGVGGGHPGICIMCSHLTSLPFLNLKRVSVVSEDGLT
jgi:hypothetical protein